MENRNKGETGKTRNSLDFEGYCVVYYQGWDKLRVQIALPFLLWSDCLCVLRCPVTSCEKVQYNWGAGIGTIPVQWCAGVFVT